MALSCWYMCSCMNGKCVMCHLQKTTNAIHSKYLTLQQYILNVLIIWLPPTRQISQESALILHLTLEGLLTLRIRTSAQQITQNIHIMDNMNEQQHRAWIAAQDKVYNIAIQAVYQFWKLQKKPKKSLLPSCPLSSQNLYLKKKKVLLFISWCVSAKNTFLHLF